MPGVISWECAVDTVKKSAAFQKKDCQQSFKIKILLIKQKRFMKLADDYAKTLNKGIYFTL